MAKTDNIGDFCADLAEGLRLKTGKTEPINAQDFRSVLDDIRTFKPEEELFVTPSTLKQEITPSDGGVFNKVTVSPVTNDIDKNITPNNIRTGTVILGVVGNLEPDKPDQTKTITPTTTQQTIYPDSGYELAGVIVNAVNPSDYYKTEESVVIEPLTKVQIKTPNDGVVYNHVVVNAVTNTIDSNIKPENIISGVSILGVNGNLQIQQVKINSENIETTGKTFATNNQDYVADFTTSGNYLAPETIEVKINNSVLTPNVDYEYTPNDKQGRLVIPANKITGDIEIVASGVKTSYDNITLSMSSANTYGGSVYYSLNDGEQTLLGKIYNYSITEGVESIVLNNVYKLIVYIDCDDVPFGTIESANGELLYQTYEGLLDVTPYLQDGLKVHGNVKG